MSGQERYLGDGLYASFDGFQIWLRAPRGDADHEVYLEPSTLLAFEGFVHDVRAGIAEMTEPREIAIIPVDPDTLT